MTKRTRGTKKAAMVAKLVNGKSGNLRSCTHLALAHAMGKFTFATQTDARIHYEGHPHGKHDRQ